MCCQAEDYLTALQFLYNGFIRALAAKDLMRCLRLVIVRRIGGSKILGFPLDGILQKEVGHLSYEAYTM